MNKSIIIVQTNLGFWYLLSDERSESNYSKRIAELPAENMAEAKEIVLAHNSVYLRQKSRTVTSQGS